MSSQEKGGSSRDSGSKKVEHSSRDRTMPRSDTPSQSRAGHWDIVLGDGSHSGSGSSSSAPNENKKFKCETCAARFERKGHLETHRTSVHEGQRNHHCTERGCDKSFGHSSSLSRHIKQWHKKESSKSSDQPSGQSSSSHGHGASGSGGSRKSGTGASSASSRRGSSSHH